MRLLRVLAALMVALGAVTASPSVAFSDPAGKPSCYEVINVYSVTIVCEYDGESLQAAQLAAPDSEWFIYQLCKDGTSGQPEACANPRVCTIGGTIGTLYAVFQDGRRKGTACLTASDATKPPPLRVLVIRAFRELQWTPSALSVQPPGGKTLVNFDTNFFTTNTSIRTISVTLQGQNVKVSARPIAYEWHFGDGTSVTTTEPGAPYPALDVSHVYVRKDKVVVSVDTQYGDASFTVNGGERESIPSTIWVTGDEQDLAIVEAMPQLVIR